MSDRKNIKTLPPVLKVERLDELNLGDLNDLSDATYAAIESGGGFGWLRKPERDVLERYWQGVVTMPARVLFVARLDGVICGTCQLMKPPPNNEAQSFSVQLTTNFVAPWARGHGLAKMLLDQAESSAAEEGYSVINLDVRETMTAAINLYEKHGYIRIGTHPYYARVDGNILKGHYYYKLIDPKAFKQEP
ncbi:MAG: GNAT family N-acetyltransferase [Rhodospirillales bacterium]|nr:GNAT family N-acetyltransferase [Alphaproteobacteria bacterium]MCB1840766.1 GNAT family N-acetyltransferase [Alphaproteobacteria bacterium]MCB9977562.1 GNAT family N-acetyltransferase [Rhodospirillales bacterium]